ncbi:SMI1/KNR4 family protein [Phenylobacterium sp.]|uniref:SMI1/KNR4 family protein n=1 Tax=Phenylobacterium sp. TaxID=1871053 RepID=UPI002812163A|nr:SMI1/KNR4 family protein [Phenylobacterium sp.]
MRSSQRRAAAVSIENLLKVVPPPAEPFESYDGPWEPVETFFGTGGLPADYKEFVLLYGSGYFMEFLGVSVPRAWNENVRIATNAKIITRNFREHEPLDPYPYGFWPDPGGLLPFGTTDNGDELFWLTEGAPDTWRVVVWDRGMQTFETFDCGLTDFLAGLATGTILPKAFPEDLLPCELLFQPDSR